MMIKLNRSIKSVVILTTCIMSFIIVSNSYSSMVRVIYFVPNDRTPNWDIPISLDFWMKEVQRFYTEQMQSHGYNKTFAIEKNKDGDVVVHYIAGKNNDLSYDYLKIEQEVKLRFDVTKDIFVVVADLSRELIDGYCGLSDFNGRMVVIPANGNCVSGDRSVYLIAHELGHAFNLEHDFRDDSYIMSYSATRRKLSDCAAYALSVNPFFNNKNYTGVNSGSNIKMLTTNEYPKGHDNWKLSFSVTDNESIHQIQFAISNPIERASILECKEFNNTKEATVEFSMPKSSTILSTNYAHIRVIDKNGFLSTKQWPLIIENTKENRSTNSNADYTHLTLTYNHISSLVPTNIPSEWWKHISYWEQTPDGKLGDKPHGAVPIETHIPYYDQWDYFFYSHAPSDIVYDLGGDNYEKFESNFFLPHPCSNIASVELIFLADGNEIYKSDVLNGSNSQNILISFDIPKGTNEFVIKVTNAGDGPGCDHFIFANAKLLHSSLTISTGGEPEKHTDVNLDGKVTLADLIIVASRYGERVKSSIIPNPDVNRDGIVDIKDIILIAEEMPLNAPPITYQPTQTELLNNYPNPFNPETWIPYRLSKGSRISIDILDIRGVPVRSINLGYREAGFYEIRSRAAYWDGRNRFGEPVASGTYFCVLRTDTKTYVKKMMMLK